MPFALVLVATFLAANVLLGPLGAGVIQWHVSAIGINQTAVRAWTSLDIVDLGFIVPAALWTGYGLWQGRGSAVKAAYALATFLTLQGASVFAMGLVMLWRQDPTASPAFFVALTPIVITMAVLTARLLASYSRVGLPLRSGEA